MPMVQIRNIHQFDKVLKNSKNPVVALFSALWVEKCRQILDVLLEISCKYTNLQIIYISAEELSDISKKFDINNLPTVILFRNNELVHRIDGYDVVELCEKCTALATDSVNYRVQALIKKASVMVFVKNVPICEYSKEIINIINETGVPYIAFDVSDDKNLEKGFREYWPTFPQVYVKGELKGGFIIIKHLHTKGELAKYLRGENIKNL